MLEKKSIYSHNLLKMSVKNRLLIFIQSCNMNVRDFEKSINASNGYVNSISKSIGIDKINVLIEKYPNINIDWLFTGRGEMLKSFKKGEEFYSAAHEPTITYGQDMSYEELKLKYVKLLEEYNSLLKAKLVESTSKHVG